MKVLGFGVVLVLLSACSSPRVLQITTTPIAKPELTLPDVDVIKTKPVEFFIITPENYAKVFAKIKYHLENKSLVLKGKVKHSTFKRLNS